MSQSELYCYFSYIGPFWIAALLGEKKASRRVRFHANQGMLLFIVEVIMTVLAVWLRKPICSIPHVGEYLWYILPLAFIAAAFALAVRGMLNVSRGEEKPLPVIGFLRLIG